jgi:hypothetical protein
MMAGPAGESVHEEAPALEPEAYHPTSRATVPRKANGTTGPRDTGKHTGGLVGAARTALDTLRRKN